MNANEALQSVVKVGDGRGFVVEGTNGRLIITAAHCLPKVPPCCSFSYLEERTYQKLIGPLGSKPTVWATCLFIDPITDIAVLGPPDDQELPSQKEDYEKLVQAALPLELSEPAENGPAWLLSLNNNWFQCTAYQSGGGLWISEAAEGIQGGMSGSPIISDGGAAIGVLCCSSAGVDGKLDTHGGPCPQLDRNLPGWALSDLQITLPSKLALGVSRS